MRIVTHDEIVDLNISALECVQWARSVIQDKNLCVLPPKISLKSGHDVFYNTMPCILPDLDCFGVKIVARHPSNFPALDSQILVYKLSDGSPMALLDGNWITAMRTGAVAAVAMETLAREGFSTVGLIGLGNCARAVVKCLTAVFPDRPFRFLLREYKDQAQLMMSRFRDLSHVRFEVVDNNQELVENAQVLVSCLTVTHADIGEDQWYPEGVLVVPVHTRGFQNCDLFFDKVFGDDTGHIQGFGHFAKFRQYAELTDVLTGARPGRESDTERILSYNIGIAVQDIYFARHIIERLAAQGQQILLQAPETKFWV